MNDKEQLLRRYIRSAAAGRVPAQHIDEVVDLAMHAMDRAFDAVSATVRLASIDPVAMSATSIALSLIAQEAAAKLAGVNRIAAEAGFTVETVTVGGANG